tara:strand:- start:8 stop:457 length:450 start_codon:yes stop_codon:yes gene_type:complete
MENFTESWSGEMSVENFGISCEDLTNHWLYFVFSGYLLPLVSPRLRNYFKELYNSCKHGEVSGKFVTLTEFGFEKIQNIENNNEMKNFIRRICIEKKIDYDEELIDKAAWLFSGDNDENHQSIKQTWKRLNETIENIQKFGDSKNSNNP